MMAQIIRSLIPLILISCSVGGIYYFFNTDITSFTKAFILAFGVQIIFFFIYNNILRFIARLKLEQETIQLAQLAQKNKILIDCQGCKITNNVSIDLSIDNKFTCEDCGAENKVTIEYSTVLPTKIVS